MSDRLIDAIREVDPCPDEPVPPPIEGVRHRLREDPADPLGARSSRRPGLSGLALVLSSGAAVAVAILSIALLSHGHRRTGAPGAAGVTACHSQARAGVLPAWARAGFSARRPRMVYALGDGGRIAAILWGPLQAPPARDRTNKILWVSRAPPASGGDLEIQAQRMAGTTRLGAPVSRRVTGGPGPSIVNLPAPGCWRMTLRWWGQRDQLDLQYGSR